MLRKPLVAGYFYEEDFASLDRQIKECFLSGFGPGTLPIKRKETKKVFGAIVPHAGYQFSGPCAAWVYKEIAETKFPDVFVIIGPNHTGNGINSTYDANWETPFGLIKAGRLEGIENDPVSHQKEHSIEVQLPFLQFANRDRLKDLKIIPISIGDYDYPYCKKIGESIAMLDEDICVIASSDFTHHGHMYNYVPFSKKIKDNIKKTDLTSIELIKNLKTKEFLKFSEDKTICGVGPIAILMETMKNKGVKKGRLLDYYMSGEILDDYTNSVSYASLIFD